MFCHENFLIIEKSSFPLLCSITHATRRRDQNFLRQLIVITYTLCHPEPHTSKRQISYQMLISIFLPLLFSFPTNGNKYIFVSCTVLFCPLFIFLFCFISNQSDSFSFFLHMLYNYMYSRFEDREANEFLSTDTSTTYGHGNVRNTSTVLVLPPYHKTKLKK